MIHKEGIKFLIVVIIIFFILNLSIFILSSSLSVPAKILLPVISIVIVSFFGLFFRNPHRRLVQDQKNIMSPADGTILSIEQVIEDEFFNDSRIRVSVFMSVWNVHINWYPVAGKITYYKYHPGKYLIARHPKSSILNERNTVVVDNPVMGEILVRQIAGTVARRIVSYAKEQNEVSQGEELGFIKFGSRVDIFLPAGITILVKPGDSVHGLITVIAKAL